MKVFDHGSVTAPCGRIRMDHPAHGVKATIIDLGFARMDALVDNGSTEICWTPFEEEIFEGEGQWVAFDYWIACSFTFQETISLIYIALCASITVAVGLIFGL